MKIPKILEKDIVLLVGSFLFGYATMAVIVKIIQFLG
jgi:hypothetical protein